MIAYDFTIKKGDLLPAITATLSDANGVVDLTGSTVKFIMTSVRSSTPQVNAAAVIVSPTAGSVRYDWAGTDTNTPGDYKAEWEVTLPSTKKLTFPNDGYLWVQVIGDLA